MHRRYRNYTSEKRKCCINGFAPVHFPILASNDNYESHGIKHGDGYIHPVTRANPNVESLSTLRRVSKLSELEMMNNDTRYKINLEMSLNYNEFWMVKGVEVLF